MTIKFTLNAINVNKLKSQVLQMIKAYNLIIICHNRKDKISFKFNHLLSYLEVNVSLLKSIDLVDGMNTKRYLVYNNIII